VSRNKLGKEFHMPTTLEIFTSLSGIVGQIDTINRRGERTSVLQPTRINDLQPSHGCSIPPPTDVVRTVTTRASPTPSTSLMSSCSWATCLVGRKRDRRLHSDRRQLSSTPRTRNLIVINCRSASTPLSTYVVNACSLKKRNAVQLLSTDA